MKRTNVAVDEDLLKEARQVLGERTYAATITRALEDTVRKSRFRQALDAFQREAGKGDFFWPGYLEEIRPNADAAIDSKKRISANETRAPRDRKRSTVRGSR